MLEGLSKMMYPIIIGLGAGIYYAVPNSITFGCMAIDIYVGIWIMLIDIVERFKER